MLRICKVDVVVFESDRDIPMVKTATQEIEDLFLRKKLSFSKIIIAMICCCVTYFVSWIFYYVGITNAFVILGLTIPPCIAFLLFAIDRKNYISIIPISIFTICHFIYGVVNYII